MPLSVVILAAGQGKRMKSDLPKVLQPVAGRPLLEHVIDTARELSASDIHVVYGHGGERCARRSRARTCTWALQAEQHGTGHAVQQAMPRRARRSPRAGALRRRAAGAGSTRCSDSIDAAAGGEALGDPERAHAGPDRLRPHRPRPCRQRRAHRRAQGREPEGTRDRRSEHRPDGGLGEAHARVARRSCATTTRRASTT